jgi:hypothetical protein
LLIEPLLHLLEPFVIHGESRGLLEIVAEREQAETEVEVEAV